MDNVTQALVQFGFCRASEIPDGDPGVLNDFVVRQLERIAATPKVVIFLDDAGGSPLVSADRDINLAVLRQGKDLRDYEDTDVFVVPAPGAVAMAQPAVGYLDQVRGDLLTHPFHKPVEGE